MSPVLYSARLKGGRLCLQVGVLQKSQGKAVLLPFTGRGRQGWSTKLAERGALGYLLSPWGRTSRYPSPVLFLEEGDRCEGRFALLASQAHITHPSFSYLVLVCPYPPKQTLSPG